jgi:hypothetical protein
MPKRKYLRLLWLTPIPLLAVVGIGIAAMM